MVNNNSLGDQRLEYDFLGECEWHMGLGEYGLGSLAVPVLVS